MIGRLFGSLLLLGGFALAFFNRVTWGDLALAVMLLGIGLYLDSYGWKIVQALKERPPKE